jgi:hypothetical protein
MDAWVAALGLVMAAAVAWAADAARRAGEDPRAGLTLLRLVGGAGLAALAALALAIGAGGAALVAGVNALALVVARFPRRLPGARAPALPDPAGPVSGPEPAVRA